MKIASILLGFLFLLSACNSSNTELGKVPDYFNMDSLIDSQVEKLKSINPELEKNAYLDGKKESVSIHLDSTGWEKELKVFRDANIDKPAYYGYYERSSSQKDTFSNLLFDEYSIEDDENVPVKSLKIFYLDTREAIKKIEIIMKDENELFESERHLLMNFESREDEPILNSYQVKGIQKLKLNDSVKYEMKGRLIF